MKLTKFLAIALASFISMGLYAQDEIHVKEIRATPSHALRMPVMMDSVNIDDKKFDAKKLLETHMTIPQVEAFTRPYIVTDTTNNFYLTKPSSDYSVQLLSFQIQSDRYSKPSINLSSTGMFELYIDGKKELSKTTVEDSLKLAKKETKKITLMPYITQNVVIKYLAAKDNKADEAIKISIKPEKEDSLTHYSFNLEGKRPTKILDIMEGTRVRGTSISPNGDFILINYYTVAKGGKASYFTELYNNKTGSRSNLGATNVRWMPKTNALYKTDSSDGKHTIVMVDPATMQESIFAENVPSTSFSISPDEQSLIFQERETFFERKGDLKAVDGPSDRQAGYYNRSYIHKYDLKTGIRTQLTFGKETTYMNDISQDARYILFSSSKENITERPFRLGSMYMLDTETLKIDTLWSNDKFAGSAKFSPDMKSVLITGAPEAFGWIGANVIEAQGKEDGQIPNSYDTQAFIMDLETKSIKAFTKFFDPTVQSVYWNKHNNLIYLTVADKDFERVYTYNPKTDKFNMLKMEEEVVSSISYAANVNQASYHGQSVMNSSKAYSYDMNKGKSKEIANPTKEIFENLTLGEVKDWSFKASDGTTIDGRYYLPPNFDASKKYPMIVYYYGGTTPTTRTFEHPYSMHVYAAQGYVVYVVQPSGTIGWGQEFSARHVNAWGIRTAEDIIEGTKKFTKDHSFVNADKIGCIGASYGGFMTMYLQTRTDIFAAAISHAGISSLASYWGEGYWGYAYSSGASAHSYPWNNHKLYIEQSPLFNADKINTPILFLHGEEDTNVPIGESIQMHTALKILGKPTEFIQVKGENHGIAKYERKLEWNYSIYSWFDRWLKDDSAWWDALYPNRKEDKK